MYDHREIEERWTKKWEEDGAHKTPEAGGGKKCYVLAMFPYPSGSGLHVGHARTYVGADVYVRMKRMQGYRTLHPMGWDAFGLPAENYAIQNGENPKKVTEENVAKFRRQCVRLGLSYDWDREIDTTDPAYYRWTQWIFLQLYKKGLAYESEEPVNWCPSCKTGLANEDLEGGTCERCGSAVEKRPMRQWMLRITDYADRLIADLETLSGWSDHVRDMQRNWIGRSDGYTIPFAVPSCDRAVPIFTTRPETLFGCAFIAISPESPHLRPIRERAENEEEINAYCADCRALKVHERGKEQTGVRVRGVVALHPITKEETPIFVADYVLAGHGTAAIFGSPAHDERDFSFATAHDLPIVQVIAGDGPLPQIESPPGAPLQNSGKHDGTPFEEAKEAIARDAGGEKTTAYRLQDWVFSRQRYWGEPIPLIHCDSCGVVPVPEEDLPVTLPDIDSYEPTGTGESPLAAVDSWVRVACPRCGGDGRRETNTMPQWAGSSWYHLRYVDPKNERVIFDRKKESFWMPVDRYVGGMEHATRHLIYARFWQKVLFDLGIVGDTEPYGTLKTVGIVQAEGGGKMSKRRGNAVDPIGVADAVGADALRLYLMQMAPFSQTVAWDGRQIAGARRFLERVRAMRDRVTDSDPSAEVTRARHRAILSVTDSIESGKCNTGVSALMIFANALQEHGASREAYGTLVRLLAPFAPFLAEEVWSSLGHASSVHAEQFPIGDVSLAREERVTISVQVKGKMRGTVLVVRDAGQDEVVRLVASDEKLAAHTAGCVVRTYVANKVISYVER